MTSNDREDKKDIALLRVRIAESKLSDRRFAVECLKRDERTVRRYLAGDVRMPPIIKELLRKPFVAPWPTDETQPMLAG